MSYEIESIGMIFFKKKDTYIFTPFTVKNIIKLRISKTGILKFLLLQDSTVSNVNIYRKTQDKIKIYSNEEEIVMNCVKDEIIKIVPKFSNINTSNITLKNIIFENAIDNSANNDVEINTNIETNIQNDTLDNAKNSANINIINDCKNDAIKNEIEAVSNVVNNPKNDTIDVIDNNNDITADTIDDLKNNSGEKKFIIVTSQWGIKIAESLKNMLEEINYRATIIKGKIDDDILEKNKKRPNEYFIILFSHLVLKMPEPNKYIIYQLEQKRQSKFVTEAVLKNILNSLVTWDYSNENIVQFDKIYKNKIVFQPISIINKVQKYDLPIIYDILFFGVGCIRRNKILKYLTKQKYNIFITSKIFGDEMYKIISQSKIILNLHVYEDAILEVARINEVLPFNKLIISELPCEGDYINKNFYQDKIIFCDVIKRNLSNIKKLTDLIDYYLKPGNYNKFIIKNESAIDKIYSYSLSHLKENIKCIGDENIKCTMQNELTKEENRQIVETDKYKLYKPKSQVMEYFKNTDSIYFNNGKYIVKFALKNSNHFDVDTFFYYKINNFKKESEVSLFTKIKNVGIEGGLIYHPKQLKNIFPNIEIFITDERKLYVKHNNEYIKARVFVKNELYNQNFDWYINQIEMLCNNLSNNRLLLLVFIGNGDIGKLLLDKIINYKKTQNFAIGVCFRNRVLYSEMKDTVMDKFKNSAIFISKEYGNDIIPTLQMYNKINQLISFDEIIKLHTKSSDIKWFNELSDYLLDKPASSLINLKNIKSNCIGPAKYYTKDKLPNINIKIMNKYKKYIEDKYFIRGTMFYCEKIVFSKIMDLIEGDYKMYFNNNLYDTNNINFTNSPVHALERFFGIIKI